MNWEETSTCEEVVAAWDAGENVWLVEMGGCGPGYEQTIQVCVIELLRDNLGKKVPIEGGWDKWGDDTIHRLNPTCHFSGAQAGAAKHAASQMLVKGYGKALAEMKLEDDTRLILCSSFWPHVGAPATGTDADDDASADQLHAG